MREMDGLSSLLFSFPDDVSGACVSASAGAGRIVIAFPLHSPDPLLMQTLLLIPGTHAPSPSSPEARRMRGRKEEGVEEPGIAASFLP